MYDLPYYKEKNREQVKKFIDDHPFAFLIGCDPENKPAATQVPIFIAEREGRQVLRGHIMRNTDHHKAFLHNENVLVIFSGPHAYISATWYSDAGVASTWNYMSVHAKGTIRFLDEIELEDILRKISLYFENYDDSSPTFFENLPSDFKQKAMKYIVGFEIEVVEMDNVFKLSQNLDAESYRNVMEKLAEQGEDGARLIATEMEKRQKDVFPGG